MGARSKIKITKKIVEDMPPGKSINDADVRGFGVRRQVRDRVFFAAYRIAGRERQMAIGTFRAPWSVETARRRAMEILGDVSRGIDPQARPLMPKSVTIAELSDRYLCDHARPYKKKSSAEIDERIIRNHLMPLIGHRAVDTLTQSDVERLHRDIRDGKTAPQNPREVQLRQRGGAAASGGPSAANRAVALLSSMLGKAEQWDLRPRNSSPCRYVRRFRETVRNRFLNTEEFQRIEAALSRRESQDSPHALAAIRLLILTGGRLSEILTLKWEHVDFENQMLRLPDSKTGPKVVRLSGPALQILRALPRHFKNPYVVVGKAEGQHLKNLGSLWDRIRVEAELPDVRIHDFRHAFASAAIAAGVPLKVVGNLLGHKRGQTTARYIHLDARDIVGHDETISAAILKKMAGAKKRDIE